MVNPLIPKDGVYALSANKLNIFLECPYKLALYLSHQPNGDVDDTYINAGQAVHAYMEESINANGGEADPPQDPEYYLKKFNVKESMNDRVLTCITNGQPYTGLKGTAEITEFTDFTTPKGRNIKLQSRIDFLCTDESMKGDSEGVIIDWKTGKQADKPEYRLQGHVYKFVHPECNVRFISLLTGDDFTLTTSPKDYIPNVCDKYVDAIENNDFERKVKPTCSKFCPYYKDYCSPEHEFDQVTPRMKWDDDAKEWTEGFDDC